MESQRGYKSLPELQSLITAGGRGYEVMSLVDDNSYMFYLLVCDSSSDLNYMFLIPCEFSLFKWFMDKQKSTDNNWNIKSLW